MGEFVDEEGRVQHMCDLCSDNNFCRALRKRMCMCPLPGGARPLSASLAAAVLAFVASTGAALAVGGCFEGYALLAAVPVVAVWVLVAVGGLTLPRRRTNPCSDVIPPSTTVFVNWIFVCLFGFMLVFTWVRADAIVE